jgi:hypothetical protein
MSFSINTLTLLTILDAIRGLTTMINLHAESGKLWLKTFANDLHSIVTMDLEL